MLDSGSPACGRFFNPQNPAGGPLSVSAGEFLVRFRAGKQGSTQVRTLTLPLLLRPRIKQLLAVRTHELADS